MEPNATLLLEIKKTPVQTIGLYYKKLYFDHTPRVEDRIYIFNSDEDEEGIFSHPVKSLYFDFNGKLDLELYPFVLDYTPDPFGESVFERFYIWSKIDGDLFEHLRYSGWTKF